MREIERRRPSEPRYALQEQWLVEYLASRPPVRVLDFGCGYGRHLKNLRALPHVELYGCDMSPTQFAKIPEYLGDPEWARTRTRLIEPLGRLPWDDGFFDLTYVSEVLIHVHPDDLPRVLEELLRVTWRRLVLIENKLTRETRVDTAAHDGCWLHDLVGAVEKLCGATVEVRTDVLSDQDIYLVDLLADTARPGDWGRAREALAVAERRVQDLWAEHLELERRREALRAKLDSEIEERIVVEAELVRLERFLRLTEERVDRADRELTELQRSLSQRVARRAAPVTRLCRKGVQLGRRLLRGKLSDTVVSGEAPPCPADRRVGDWRDLPFAGIADAGTPDPDAFRAARPEIAALCHPRWRGIRAAAYSLTPHVLEVSEVHDAEHAGAIGAFLLDAGVRILVIQGMPPGTERLAVELHRRHPRLRILQVFHGSTAQQGFPTESRLLDAMLELTAHGVIHRIGFVKHGLGECLRRIGYPAFAISNKIEISETPPEVRPFHGGEMKIGAFMQNLLHKNFSTQALAAFSIPGSVVHMIEPPVGVRLERFPGRFHVHGLMPHAEFLRQLGAMDVNLYVSHTECYPMTVIESLGHGVVCVTSDTSPIFDGAPDLREALVVTAADDPWAIAQRCEAAVGDRVRILRRAHEHLAHANERADALWSEFTRG